MFQLTILTINNLTCRTQVEYFWIRLGQDFSNVVGQHPTYKNRSDSGVRLHLLIYGNVYTCGWNRKQDGSDQ